MTAIFHRRARADFSAATPHARHLHAPPPICAPPCSAAANHGYARRHAMHFLSLLSIFHAAGRSNLLAHSAAKTRLQMCTSSHKQAAWEHQKERRCHDARYARARQQSCRMLPRRRFAAAAAARRGRARAALFFDTAPTPPSAAAECRRKMRRCASAAHAERRAIRHDAATAAVFAFAAYTHEALYAMRRAP